MAGFLFSSHSSFVRAHSLQHDSIQSRIPTPDGVVANLVYINTNTVPLYKGTPIYIGVPLF